MVTLLLFLIYVKVTLMGTAVQYDLVKLSVDNINLNYLAIKFMRKKKTNTSSIQDLCCLYRFGNERRLMGPRRPRVLSNTL